MIAALRRYGLLLMHDRERPSVSALVAGGPVRGSWWAHPKGRAIFRAANTLHDHPDVVAVKLIDGKVTFVHRRLWPALNAVALAASTKGLSSAARRLLARVRRVGELRASGPAVKELERRLLVRTAQVHTERGAHELVVRPWSLRTRSMTLARARAVLEKSCARAALPW